MLTDYYHNYEREADLLKEDWRTENKNDLCNKYLNAQSDADRSKYVAAIICRYWNMLCSSYGKCFSAVEEEDAYTWFTRAILYVLKTHPWTNPNHKLYNDKNGPDKCINICIESSRNTYFQQSNRYNRKINHETDSLDRLSEEYKDTYMPGEDNIANDEEYDKDLLVKKTFLSGDIFFAVMIDMIFNSNVFTENKDGTVQFDKMKLVKNIKSIDVKYVKYFAKRYELVESKLNELYNYSKASKQKILNSIEFNLQALNVRR